MVLDMIGFDDEERIDLDCFLWPGDGALKGEEDLDGFFGDVGRI